VKINNTVSEPIPISGNITSTPGATYYASDAIGSVNIVQSIPLNVSVSGATGTIGVVTINPDGLPVYGGSGSGSSVSVTDIFGTVGTNVVNPDGRLKVELPTGSSGLTDTELRATPLQVQQVSGYADSVSVISTVGLTNTELRANTLDVQQVSGTSWSTAVLSMPSVVVTSITNSTGVTLLNGEGIARDTWGAVQTGTWNIGTLTGITNSTASALVDSLGVQYSGSNPVPVTTQRALESLGLDVMTVRQVSGASDSVSVLSMPNLTVTSITNSTAVSLVDSIGVAYEGANPLPVSGPVTQSGTWNITTLTGVTNTLAVANIDSTGAQYSGSNPFPMRVVTDATASLNVSLVDSGGVGYSGSNPVPTKEIKPATGTNTSVADNAASVTILASNTSRIGATVYNDSSAILYLLLGTGPATTTNYTCKVASSGYYEVPFGFTGQLTGIWASDPNDGAARVTEIT
jgi:hypothetical protein